MSASYIKLLSYFRLEISIYQKVILGILYLVIFLICDLLKF